MLETLSSKFTMKFISVSLQTHTCHHQCEVKAFLHRLPVDLVGQSCKAHILFLLGKKMENSCLVLIRDFLELMIYRIIYYYLL